MIFWIFGIYVYFDQKKGIMESLKTSKNLVKGRWWRVLGYLILLILIYLALSIAISLIAFILTLPFNLMDGISFLQSDKPMTPTYFIASTIINSLGKLALSLIATPFGLIFFRNLYNDFKKSKK